MKAEHSYSELAPTITTNGLEATRNERVDQHTGEKILAKKPCNAGPNRETVDDDNEYPRKDTHCHHLQLRVGVRVVFVTLDEVSTACGPGEAEDRYEEGDYLGVGNCAGGEDDPQLNDTLRTRF